MLNIIETLITFHGIKSVTMTTKADGKGNVYTIANLIADHDKITDPLMQQALSKPIVFSALLGNLDTDAQSIMDSIYQTIVNTDGLSAEDFAKNLKTASNDSKAKTKAKSTKAPAPKQAKKLEVAPAPTSDDLFADIDSL